MKFRRKFAGWPRTRPYRLRNGSTGYRVTLHVLTPLRAKIANGLAVYSVITLLTGGVAACAAYEVGEFWPWLTALVGPFIAHPSIEWFWGKLLERELVLSIDRYRIRRHTLWPYRPFDTRRVDGFSRIEHPEAEFEAFRHGQRQDEAAAKGKVLRLRPYYQNSWLLEVVYAGKPVRILPIYRTDHAKQIVEHLQAILEEVVSGVAERADEPENNLERRPSPAPGML